MIHGFWASTHWDERVRLSPSLQVRYFDEPFAVSKAPSLAGSTTFDVRRRHGCRKRRVPRRLRGPITFQPRI
jgi:hypothetical protein